MRPVISGQFQSAHGNLSKIMEYTWDKEPEHRPSFAMVLETLGPSLLWYTLNEDPTATNMWSRYFKDRTTVTMTEFLTALWKAVNGSDLPDPGEDSYIYIKCVEAVIKTPGHIMMRSH